MIRVDQPQKYDLVSNTVQIAGIAGGAFEASYNWRITEGHDEVTGYFMAGDGMGGHGQFQVSADVSKASFKLPRLFVEVFHLSAKDGGELDKVTVPVYLGNKIVDDYTGYVLHKVKKGESLWGIARDYYGNGKLYNRLTACNDYSGVLHPGELIRVPR